MTAAIIDLALGLAVLVVVPLALGLDERRPADRKHLTVVLVAGGLAVVSLLPDEGAFAAGLALPWLAVTVMLALRHLFPLDVRALLRDTTAVLPFVYLTVGAGWLVVSRYGGRPLDFDDTIVELTAVHFHYAGFVAPLVVHRLGRRLRSSSAGAALAAVLVATPLTAAGITFEPAMGAAGAILFAGGLTAASLLTLRRVVPTTHGAAATFLVISSASVVVAMGLAVAYALGQWLGTPAPSLPVMARTHGVLNSAGFGLCGVLGWRRA